MSNETKTALFGFGIGAIVFIALITVFKKKEPDEAKPVNKEGIGTAVSAYKLALENKEDLDALNKLNKQLEEQYGVNVALTADGIFVVSNTKGTEIQRIYYSEV